MHISTKNIPKNVRGMNLETQLLYLLLNYLDNYVRHLFKS